MPDLDGTRFTDQSDLSRPAVYHSDDGWTIRGSALGHCLRSLVLTARGFLPAPFPAGIRDAMEAGHDWEEYLVLYMRRGVENSDVATDFLTNWAISQRQAPYTLELLPDYMISLHIDAVGRRFGTHADGGGFDTDDLSSKFHPSNNHPYVVEYKSFGNVLVNKFANDLTLGNLPAYAIQLSVEMIATGYPGLFVVLDKDSPDPDNPDIYYQIFEKPPIGKGQLIARLAEFRRWMTDPDLIDQLPPCDDLDPGFCPFYNYHDKPPVSSRAVDKQVEELIARWAQLGEDVRLLTKERDSVRDTLKQIISLNEPVAANGKTFGFYEESAGYSYDWDGMAALIDELSPGLDIESFRTPKSRVMPRYS